MRFSLLDIPGLLCNPMGRRQLRSRAYQSLWPLAYRAAAVHRRTRARSVRLVAVVGSFGKTTAARALGALLCGPRWRLGGNCLSRVAEGVLRLRPGDRHGVIEIGVDRPGQMAAYARLLRPDVTVVTSIGSEHHRLLGGIEGIRSQKAEMVRALGPGGLAALNGDDPSALWMAGLTRERVVTFGLGPGNAVRATDARLDWPAGMRFTLHAGGQSREVRTRLLGPPAVYACLAAAAVGLAEGLSLAGIAPVLEALAPTPGRLDPLHLPGGAVVLRDEYKGTWETFCVALDVLGTIPARRRIAVLGPIFEPLGDEGRLYEDLGARAARVASKVFLLCGRHDSACSTGAAAAGLPRSAIVETRGDLFEAARRLRDDLRAGDVVLVKGGGHRQQLSRVTLLLQGRPVGCRISSCRVPSERCDECPAVQRGWGRSKVMEGRP